MAWAAVGARCARDCNPFKNKSALLAQQADQKPSLWMAPLREEKQGGDARGGLCGAANTMQLASLEQGGPGHGAGTVIAKRPSLRALTHALRHRTTFWPELTSYSVGMLSIHSLRFCSGGGLERS